MHQRKTGGTKKTKKMIKIRSSGAELGLQAFKPSGLQVSGALLFAL